CPGSLVNGGHAVETRRSGGVCAVSTSDAAAVERSVKRVKRRMGPVIIRIPGPSVPRLFQSSWRLQSAVDMLGNCYLVARYPARVATKYRSGPLTFPRRGRYEPSRR